jgi:predicted anti-sigma-YlaC factor YlaD
VHQPRPDEAIHVPIKLFSRKQLSCQELVEIVTDYLEDAMSHSDRARFESHLQACGGCRAYLAQMRTMLDVLGRIDEEELDPVVVDEWLEAFRGWHSS